MAEEEKKNEKREYKKIKTLGQGQFGIARLCKDQFNNKCVVKKICLDKKMYTDEKSIKNAIMESKVMKVFYHPNIVAF